MLGVFLMKRGSRVFPGLGRSLRRLQRKGVARFFVVAVFLPLLILEFILRATGHYATYTERIGYRYASPYEQINRTPWILDSGVSLTCTYGRLEFDFDVRTNREGVRDIEHPVEKPEGEFRIVGLGDSFTEGVGAAFEDSYLRVLDRRLKSRFGVDRVRVISGGVSASDPVFAYHLLVRRLLKYEPDLVILMINESDISDIMMRGGMDRFDAHGMMRGTQSPASEWFFERSHLVRAAMMTFGGYDFFLLRPQERLERQKAALPVLVQVGEALKALGDGYGFECLIAAQPFTWTSVEKNLAGYSKHLQEQLTEKGIPFADLTEPFLAAIERKGTRDYRWPVDGHYNAKGYEALAEVVEQTLRAEFRSPQYPWSQGNGDLFPGPTRDGWGMRER